MRLKACVDEAHGRWRKFAETTATLSAASKRLRDDDPQGTIDFITKTGGLLSEITDAAVRDLESDADELELLAFLRDPDVIFALTKAGSRLRDLWLFTSLKGLGLLRADVKAVISACTKHLT